MPSALDRRDVTFKSEGGQVAAWVYPAAGGPVPGPAVVMAHGFSLTRHDGLDPYARALAGAGATVIAFDHRFLGDAPGQPRQRSRRAAQLADWGNAVAFARTRPEVDPARVVLWGFGRSGGHAVVTAAGDPRIAGVLLLCPILHGTARVWTRTLAHKIAAPVWVGQGDHDVSVSPVAIGKLVAAAAGAELHRYPVDHVEPLRPESAALIAADQARFLAERVVDPSRAA